MIKNLKLKIKNWRRQFYILIFFVGLFLITPDSLAVTDVLPEPPKMISRHEWGADESWRTNQAYWPETEDGGLDPQAKVIVLHHTASSNLQSDADQSGRYAGMVRDIYRFHTKSKLWYDEAGQKHYGIGDIAYNYLVDINGNVYQGRYGGNGIVGAHAAGFNTGSIGVGVIGTYGGTIQGQYLDHQITARLKNSLINFIGWLAATNDIDLSQKTRICNFEGENCRYTYPLVGHRDVGNTQCPGNSLYSLIPEIRQEAVNLALKYKDYLYQIQGEPPVYLLRAGTKKPYESLASFQQKIGAYTKLNYIAKTTAELFPLEAIIKFRDGNLVKADNSSVVYLLKDNLRRPIASVNLFNAHNLDWSKINVLTNIEISAFGLGEKLLYPDGVLAKGSSDKVYLIEDEKRRHIASALVFEKYGYDWSDILTVSDAELIEHRPGHDLLLPTGSLVKTADNSLVYLVEQDQRRPISSADIFLKHQFAWDDILTLDSSELALYQPGKLLLLPDDSLIKLADKPEVYLVKQSQSHWVTNWSVLKDIGLQAAEIIKLSLDEFKNYALGSAISNLSDWQKIAQASQPPTEETEERIEATVSDDGSTTSTSTSSEEEVIADEKVSTEVSTNVSTSETEETTDLEPDEETEAVAEESNLGPLMRVAIFSPQPGQEFVITGLSGYQIYKNNQLQETKQAGQLFTMVIPDCTVCSRQTDDIYQFVPAETIHELSLQQESQPVIEITSYQARPAWNPSLNDNQFRGKIELGYSSISNKWWVINELPLEQYIWGVAEITNEQAPEYLKAMTIAARSYANYHLSRGGKHKGEDFILNNTANDQVYKGYGFEKRADKVNEAGLATAGQVLMFNTSPAVTPYSSDSGGVSIDACKLWGLCDPQYAYLRGGVKDPVATEHNPAIVAISHGVGLSAVGARQMAKEGATYPEILIHYYPDTEIEKKY